MTGTYAKVIADSITESGDRLVTIEAQFHRFVLAEFNTHRMFSRNSASSRAIPVAKQVKRVRDNTAYPVEFGSNQAGMQAGAPLEGVELQEAQDLWWEAANMAADYAERLMDLGVHKQVTNRLLEPFMWHKVIVTSTDWDNFLKLRCSPLAQPEIRVAADMIQEQLTASTPELILPGGWHLPYISDEDRVWARKVAGLDATDLLMKVAVARCARVSYLTHDGVRDQLEDVEMFNRLVSASPPHASPLEHVATPNVKNKQVIYYKNTPYGWVEVDYPSDIKRELPRLGNLLGWDQLRHRV